MPNLKDLAFAPQVSLNHAVSQEALIATLRAEVKALRKIVGILVIDRGGDARISIRLLKLFNSDLEYLLDDSTDTVTIKCHKRPS